ncbi:metallophosphoesterase family protein [Desmospora profundinema]|uniref:DNA repair exonuclease SbcCD nuclease subunit n=1 Tax=Desmospora profundinema TaxID=1571184 RepID=A0ABU1IM44_9BACL|nr:DNA repair exonuclease [Desmospora profundinema]MDR6225234.1 DNA repair exonuclease SbcCD nuclease subunit [Desmospora profundinema]
MKPITFIHTADLHLDLPFQGWRGSDDVLLRWRDEHRRTFAATIDTVMEKQTDYLLIAGDWLEYETASRSTAEWLIEQLERIKNTQVLIAPGNHDPFRPDSYYHSLSWPEHVTIFTGDWEERRFPEHGLTVVGRGFREFEEPEAEMPSVRVPEGERLILLFHGTLQNGNAGSPYFPVTKEKLAPLEADYVALGHIHQPHALRLNNQKRTWVRYPGSPHALRWQETGERSVTWGRLSDSGCHWEPVSVQTRRFEVDMIPLEGCKTDGEALKQIKQMIPEGKERDACRRLVLNGRRQAGWKPRAEWLSLQLKQSGFYHVEIVDETLPDYDLEWLRSQEGLVGTFVRKMEERMERTTMEEREHWHRALLKGLDALLSPEVKKP